VFKVLLKKEVDRTISHSTLGMTGSLSRPQTSFFLCL